MTDRFMPSDSGIVPVPVPINVLETCQNSLWAVAASSRGPLAVIVICVALLPLGCTLAFSLSCVVCDTQARHPA